MGMTTFGIPGQFADWNRDGVFNTADGDGLALTTIVSYVAFVGWKNIDNWYPVNIEVVPTAAAPATTNGTPVFWLDRFELATDETDPDDDGFQTSEENICGTGPTNGLSFFQIDRVSNRLEFATASNRLYDVESCSSLIASPSGLPTWKNVTNNLPGSGNFIAFPVSPTNSAAFYCVNVRLP